ncbi:hypothetical protein BDZ89DRAFT_929220, partial [Hymenopellis radicata]
MPQALPEWAEACRRAGEGFAVDARQIPPSGINNGYSLPDPNIITVVKNDTTCTGFFSVWLKLRIVILYLLQTPRYQPLRTQQWWSLLGLSMFSSDKNTKLATTRRELQALLQKNLKHASMEALVDLSNLEAAPMERDQLRREVLWELFEVNFRCEMVRLDRHCYRFL